MKRLPPRRKAGKTPEALHTLEKTGARQTARPLADHQRTAQRLLRTRIQRGQMLEGRCQGLHGGAG